MPEGHWNPLGMIPQPPVGRPMEMARPVSLSAQVKVSAEPACAHQAAEKQPG